LAAPLDRLRTAHAVFGELMEGIELSFDRKASYRPYFALWPRVFCAALFAYALPVVPAFAAVQPPAEQGAAIDPSAVLSTPGANSQVRQKTFGKWTLVCTPAAKPDSNSGGAPAAEAGAAAKMFCRITTQISKATKPQPGASAASAPSPKVFATVSLALAGAAGDGILLMRLPPGLKTGGEIAVGVPGATSIAAKIGQCNDTGCFAEARIAAAAIAQWRAAATLEILVPRADNKPAQIALALEGFSEALNALEDLRKRSSER